MKTDGAPMRIYSGGALRPSAEVAARAVTAVCGEGESYKLSPKLAMPTTNDIYFQWGYLGFQLHKFSVIQ